MKTIQTNILEYLEKTSERLPDKIAFADDQTHLSFRELQKRAMSLGTFLAGKKSARGPVIVYMEKTPDMIAAFLGVVYSGCYYVPIDEEMPARRIELIIENTQAEILICDEKTRARAEEFNFDGTILLYSEGIATGADRELLADIRRQALALDPVCVFYTSGSTGIPKGVVVCHRGIIDYTEQLSQVLTFDENCVFANQTPLYWDASMKELYATLKHGATTYLVPRELFMFPVKLVEYLNRNQINTLCWVVSALVMISAYSAFDIARPEYLKLVAFCGEVFPVKQFNIWKEQLPDVEFYNLYGPTEATGVSTYYHADRLFEAGETIPIGKPFDNTRILLLDEMGNRVKEGETGEICICGDGLTLGYYRDAKRTEDVFVQNPGNSFYRELLYRTGDLARQDSEGNLVFVSRLDHQIKHMGHRIELGEIEADVGLADGVKQCCCIYSREKNKIVLFYTGKPDKATLPKELKSRLPRYMLPNAIFQMKEMPLTANGKMNRTRMEEIYRESLSEKNHKKTQKNGG